MLYTFFYFQILLKYREEYFNCVYYFCSLSPYSFDVSPSPMDAPHFTHDSIPIGVIPVLSTISPQYREALRRTIATANSVYRDFLKSEKGLRFSGTVSIIG